MKLSPEHKALYKAIDEILWEDWDSIGMKYFEGPRNEYERYVPTIFSLKIKAESIEIIAQILFQIQTDVIRIDGRYQNCKRVAEKIFNLK
ncbi:MAG TPA: hypothetical protein VL442_12140 [Mucilaginibacter sp.]|jgi:hypothetical protein|nr:hypothetical protein [Mucilaginibacter sp.]